MAFETLMCVLGGETQNRTYRPCISQLSHLISTPAISPIGARELQDHGLQPAAGGPRPGPEPEGRGRAGPGRRGRQETRGSAGALLHRPGVHPGGRQGGRGRHHRRHVSRLNAHILGHARSAPPVRLLIHTSSPLGWTGLYKTAQTQCTQSRALAEPWLHRKQTRPQFSMFTATRTSVNTARASSTNICEAARPQRPCLEEEQEPLSDSRCVLSLSGWVASRPKLTKKRSCSSSWESSISSSRTGADLLADYINLRPCYFKHRRCV